LQPKVRCMKKGVGAASFIPLPYMWVSSLWPRGYAMPRLTRDGLTFPSASPLRVNAILDHELRIPPGSSSHKKSTRYLVSWLGLSNLENRWVWESHLDPLQVAQYRSSKRTTVYMLYPDIETPLSCAQRLGCPTLGKVQLIGQSRMMILGTCLSGNHAFDIFDRIRTYRIVTARFYTTLARVEHRYDPFTILDITRTTANLLSMLLLDTFIPQAHWNIAIWPLDLHFFDKIDALVDSIIFRLLHIKYHDTPDPVVAKCIRFTLGIPSSHCQWLNFASRQLLSIMHGRDPLRLRPKLQRFRNELDKRGFGVALVLLDAHMQRAHEIRVAEDIRLRHRFLDSHPTHQGALTDKMIGLKKPFLFCKDLANDNHTREWNASFGNHYTRTLSLVGVSWHYGQQIQLVPPDASAKQMLWYLKWMAKHDTMALKLFFLHNPICTFCHALVSPGELYYQHLFVSCSVLQDVRSIFWSNTLPELISLIPAVLSYDDFRFHIEVTEQLVCLATRPNRFHAAFADYHTVTMNPRFFMQLLYTADSVITHRGQIVRSPCVLLCKRFRPWDAFRTRLWHYGYMYIRLLLGAVTDLHERTSLLDTGAHVTAPPVSWSRVHYHVDLGADCGSSGKRTPEQFARAKHQWLQYLRDLSVPVTHVQVYTDASVDTALLAALHAPPFVGFSALVCWRRFDPLTKVYFSVHRILSGATLGDITHGEETAVSIAFRWIQTEYTRGHLDLPDNYRIRFFTDSLNAFKNLICATRETRLVARQPFIDPTRHLFVRIPSHTGICGNEIVDLVCGYNFVIAAKTYVDDGSVSFHYADVTDTPPVQQLFRSLFDTLASPATTHAARLHSDDMILLAQTRFPRPTIAVWKSVMDTAITSLRLCYDGMNVDDPDDS